MDDLIKSSATFGLHINDYSEMDATLLANTIRDFAELTKAAAKEEDPEAYLKMNVTAFRNGSFQIDFSTVCMIGEKLITGAVYAAGFALTVVGIVKGFLEIKKLLKGEKPKSITKIGDGNTMVENNVGDTITVRDASVAIIDKKQIDSLIVNITQYIYEHNQTGGFCLKTQDGNVECSADDIKNMIKPMPISTETICKQTTEEATLAIKKADLTGRSAWDFKHRGKTIPARIDDDKWISEVNEGKIPIRAGDYIIATLETRVEMDEMGAPIQDTEKYNIIKVHKIANDNTEQTKLW
jgi:hypothetical protein